MFLDQLLDRVVALIEDVRVNYKTRLASQYVVARYSNRYIQTIFLSFFLSFFESSRSFAASSMSISFFLSSFFTQNNRYDKHLYLL